MSAKALGTFMAVLGLAAVVISILADRIGVGAAPDVFGWKQILGSAIGLFLMAGGVMLTRRRDSQG